MKGIYVVLLMLVVIASVSGCVNKKQTETSNIAPQGETKASPVQTASPAETPDAGIAVPSNGADQFGIEADIAAIDSIVNESNMDISLSDSI